MVHLSQATPKVRISGLLTTEHILTDQKNPFYSTAQRLAIAGGGRLQQIVETGNVAGMEDGEINNQGQRFIAK